MYWFFIALAGSLFYAAANHIDKYLIDKYFQNREVGALIIFSSIFSIFALPIILFIHPEVFLVTLFQGITLVVTGMLVVIAIMLFYYALREDEATDVIPFFQMTPIFAFALGYLILGETITFLQAIASLLIIAGSVVLSFKLGRSKVRFKGKVVLFMLLASLFYAFSSVIFKLVALDEGFWLSTFWSLVGKVMLGGFFIIAIPLYRNQFLTLIRENKLHILALNSVDETFTVLADAFVGFATLLAPVAIVLLAGAFQSVFTFLIGVLLAIFLPRISKESLSTTHLFQKILAISIIMIGTYFLWV